MRSARCLILLAMLLLCACQSMAILRYNVTPQSVMTQISQTFHVPVESMYLFKTYVESSLGDDEELEDVIPVEGYYVIRDKANSCEWHYTFAGKLILYGILPLTWKKDNTPTQEITTIALEKTKQFIRQIHEDHRNLSYNVSPSACMIFVQESTKDNNIIAVSGSIVTFSKTTGELVKYSGGFIDNLHYQPEPQGLPETSKIATDYVMRVEHLAPGTYTLTLGCKNILVFDKLGMTTYVDRYQCKLNARDPDTGRSSFFFDVDKANHRIYADSGDDYCTPMPLERQEYWLNIDGVTCPLLYPLLRRGRTVYLNVAYLANNYIWNGTSQLADGVGYIRATRAELILQHATYKVVDKAGKKLFSGNVLCDPWQNSYVPITLLTCLYGDKVIIPKETSNEGSVDVLTTTNTPATRP